MKSKTAPLPHTKPDAKCGGGEEGVANDRTIRRLRDVESLESEPSSVACKFLLALLCRGHLLSETTRGQGA